MQSVSKVNNKNAHKTFDSIARSVDFILMYLLVTLYTLSFALSTPVSSQLAFTFSKSIVRTPIICEICSKLTIKTPERHLVNVNFEQIAHFAHTLLCCLNS